MQKEQLTLTLAGGQQLLFNVEVAETHIQRENGLMNRASLPEMEGMLFDFKETLPVQMWMKDTSIPLDMIFLDQNGAVVKIHENAEPNSLAIIQSEIPVYAVLEVIAGTAAKLGIAPGAVATHRIFTPIPEAATPADAAPSAPAPQ